MLRFISFSLVAALFFATAPGFAQDAVKGAPLTSSRVSSFINSLKQIRDIDRKHGGKGALADKKKAGQNDWSPFAGAARSIQAHAGQSQMMAAIQSAGFKNAGDWAQTGTRIYQAYGAIQMGAQQPELAAKMAKARAQIEKSKMSPEQKKAILQMMQQQMGVLAAFQNVPAGDKAAVKPHIATLDAMNK
jgi:hypothetical protein